VTRAVAVILAALAPCATLSGFAMARDLLQRGIVTESFALGFMLASLAAGMCFTCAAAAFLESSKGDK
jgi:hypothetical protein